MTFNRLAFQRTEKPFHLFSGLPLASRRHLALRGQNSGFDLREGTSLLFQKCLSPLELISCESLPSFSRDH